VNAVGLDRDVLVVAEADAPLGADSVDLVAETIFTLNGI
jgi:hypothetical protein